MKYFLLALVCFCFSAQFVFFKRYQSLTDKLYGESGKTGAAAFALLLTALSVLLVLTPFGIASFSFNASALAVACIYSCGFVLSSFATLFALRRGALTTVTTFTLTGSIVLPFSYGIYLNEDIGALRIVGVVLIVLSLVPDIIAASLSGKKGDNTPLKAEKSRKNNFVFIVLCLLVFLANGCAATSVKAIRVVAPEVSGISFLSVTALLRLFAAVAVLVILAITKKHGRSLLFRHEKAEPEATPSESLSAQHGRGVGKPVIFAAVPLIVFGALYALSNTFGTVFNLECAKVMDSSVQFPVSNAAIIIASTLVSIFIFREKPKISTLTGAFLAVAGIIVYAL